MPVHLRAVATAGAVRGPVTLVARGLVVDPDAVASRDIPETGPWVGATTRLFKESRT